MRRKTNLFYTSGPDSKFITFSNYTESMTGNFLSTDTKLFPSRFICAYFDNFNKENKERLIKLCAEYYESKLAAVRDYYKGSKENPEHKVLPFNYLLEMLNSVTKSSYGEYELNEIKSCENAYSVFSMPYISDITEQDYNGSFTDAICIVDLNRGFKGSAYYSVKEDVSFAESYIYSPDTYIYGWENNEIYSDRSYFNYESCYSIYDETEDSYGRYYITSYIDYIELSKADEDILVFNAVIPLFDVVDINYKTNTVSIEESYTETVSSIETVGNVSVLNTYTMNHAIDLTDSQENDLYTKNVPLGIWFSDNCEPITLKRDKETGFAPSWSLSIASQFKPFPYSKDMPNELTPANNVNAFATFAQVLNNQNSLISTLSSISETITDLSNRIDSLASQLNHLGTSYTIDGMHKEIIDNDRYMNQKMESFKQEILSYLSGLQWKASI